MPRLSDTMEEGTVASWLKKVGDKIEEGDILAEIETDKATMEFESFNEGTLLHIGIQEGETAKVDTLLAIIGEEGEDISGLLKASANESKEEEDVAGKHFAAGVRRAQELKRNVHAERYGILRAGRIAGSPLIQSQLIASPLNVSSGLPTRILGSHVRDRLLSTVGTSRSAWVRNLPRADMQSSVRV